nr:hypothetical protein HUO10_003072 [Paraburkholderia busanensis]
MPYVTVTICLPDAQRSDQCTTVDHMQLDTGSVGIRVLASALGPALAARLPSQTGATDDPTGSAPLAECAVFGSGYTWGTVRRADVTIGGKSAGNLPLQVISDGRYPAPSDCRSRGVTDLGTAADMGANGVLGIGPATRDYPAAAQAVLAAGYYYCGSAGSCSNTRVPLDTQVANPVANFASDNNGTIIRLPSVPPEGSLSVTGTLVFGIGTQQNNALPPNLNILALDPYGYFPTTYKGTRYTSAIDSGSNANLFYDATVPYSGWWYMPVTTLSLSAILSGVDRTATPVTVPFTLANGWTLRSNGNVAYDSLGSPSAGMFVWGLPFFFGRSVYTAIGNVPAGKQQGAFIAF